MLIKPDVVPDYLPDKARATWEGQVPDARGNPVLVAGGRKTYSCRNFMYGVSSTNKKYLAINAS